MAGGPSAVDQATIAFRRLLSEASNGEQTRVDALVVLAQRSVFAATWPGQNQAVRTLTNSGGETAMPLFTGRDVLTDTAARFGWLNPDGSLSFRELAAREALRHALGRGVHFVVIDIGSDHAVEFAREEIEPLLQLQNQQLGTGPFAAAGEPQAAIREAVRRSTRPPPGPSTQVARPLGKAAAVEIDMPFSQLKAGASKSPPARGISQPMPPARAVSQPLGTRPRTASQPMPAVRPPAQPRLPQAASVKPPAGAQPMVMGSPTLREARAPSVQPPSFGLPEARMSTASGTGMPSSRPPSAAAGGGAVAAQKTAALEVAAALTSAARAAGDPEAQKAAEQMARMLMHDAAASDAASEPRDESKAAAKRMAALLMGDASPEEEAERESGEQEKQATGPLSLPDALLHAMSQALRAFPEVEWACVMSDDSDLPVVGVRVDPSFLNRVAQITDAIVSSADKQGQQVQVLLLNTIELVKNARKNGKAFYPWKR
jgi:hypothetical protein